MPQLITTSPDAPLSLEELQVGAGMDLKSAPLPEVARQLHSSEEGLSQAEAEKRLRIFGRNELKERTVNPLLAFLTYFWGPIPWMIEAAALLSALIRHWPDCWIILVLLLANAAVGFWEERQASNAIAALKATLAIRATVKRDRTWKTTDAGDLVPGDVTRHAIATERVRWICRSVP